MVKKSNFLDKLKNRWRPASGIRIDSPHSASTGIDPRPSATSHTATSPTATSPNAAGRGVGAPPSAGASQSAPSSNRLQPMMAEAEMLSSRKLSSKEEAVVAIHEGFKDLASLLRGMQTRIDSQGQQIGSAAESLGRLPALNEAQVDLMRTMVERLERQNTATTALHERLADMPEMMRELRTSLEQVAATDRRTATTLDEFKGNMARIQVAMSQMVEHSGQHASASTTLAAQGRDQQDKQAEAVREMADRLDRGQQGAIAALQSSTESNLQGLRKAQTEQSERVAKLVESNQRGSKVMIGLLVAAVVSLVVIAILLATA